MLDTFIRIAPTQAQAYHTRDITPGEDKFSGFVFKIHANLDPKHRDRIAFLRVCSGRFERNTLLSPCSHGTGFPFSNPYTFMARQKEVIEDAYPGMWWVCLIQAILKLAIRLPKARIFILPVFPVSARKYSRKYKIRTRWNKAAWKGFDAADRWRVAQLYTVWRYQKKSLVAWVNCSLEVIQYRLYRSTGHRYRWITCPFIKPAGCTARMQKNWRILPLQTGQYSRR